MVIHNETTFTSEEAIAELISISKKYYIKRFYFPIVLALFGIIILIIVSLEGNKTDTYIIGSIFLVLSLVFVILNIISLIRVPKLVKKKNPDIEAYGMVNSFVFKEESLFITVKVGSSVRKQESSYAQLKKIVEYEDRINFIMHTNTMHICKKSGFKNQKEMEVFFYGLSKHNTKIKKKIRKEK